MGTKVYCKSYLPEYYSMRDLNEDSSSSSWPLFYGEKPVINGQCYNGYSGHEKDALKQKMLEHEAIFKNQVRELHRLYKIQKDMMEEAKRKHHHKHRKSLEPSSSSSLHGSQMPSEEAQKWHMAGFPVLNYSSPMSCTRAYNTTQQGPFPSHDGPTSKDLETMESRPSKVRKKLFDLQLPADEYLDNEDGEKSRRDVVLADLNEPIQVEEGINGDIKGINQTVGSKAGYLGVIQETDGFCINSSMEIKVNERGWLFRMYEEGSSRNNLSSVTQDRDMDKLRVHHSHGIYPNGNNRENHWRDGPHHGLESSNRTRDPFFSSCFPSSWAKPASNFAQKLTTYGSCSNSAIGTSTSLPFGGKWQANGSSSSSLFPGLRSESTPVNGFYHDSASGFKESHVNCSRGENVNSDRTTNNGFFENSQKGPCREDSRPALDINLNEVVSTEMQDLNAIDGKSNHEDYLSALPWLKPKPVHGCKNEKVVLTCNSEILRKKEIIETQNVKKILGIPIVIRENEPSSANLDCHLERKNGDNERKKRIIDINVACELDEDEELNEKRDKGVFIRDHIDLNSCFSECEESKSGNVQIPLEIDLEVSIFPENDDDNTPPDDNKPKNEQIQDEILRKAAEMLVSISLFCPQRHTDDSICLPEASLAQSLLWFVNACGNELESPSRPNGPHDEDFSEEMDDFEATTLKLEETKEEDYMPKPFCPEFQRIEDDAGPNNALNTRPRRGQARRGRQRRDFQRYVLPGLVSLSRHEVTEDIQTFGGLMRATGHSWNSGLTRRNGPGRGRRRRAVVETGPVISPSPVCGPLSQQRTNIEAGLEDRSLTGWGKTTRRPRRQRCHAGNNSTQCVVLT